MTSTPENPTGTGAARDASDETIELELTEDQGQALARAAAEATHADDASPDPSVPGYMNLAFRPTARIEFVCNVTLAVLAAGFALVFLWPKSVAHTSAPVLARIAAPITAVMPAPAPPEPEGPPVRITNAFDATEVFEFPFGTSETEARQAVEELLLNRARERHAAGMALRPVRSTQRGRTLPGEQSPPFVTKLLARTKFPLSDAN
jgi:hypothetical protein